jgi:hypothetical protein
MEFIMDADTTASASNSRILDGVMEGDESHPDEGDDSDSEHDEHAASVFTGDAQSTRSRGTTATSATSKQKPQQEVKRRTQLPSGPVGDEGSLFSVLKKNVGKVGPALLQYTSHQLTRSQDLSQVVMPVSFNEPLTLLQRTAEEFEYYSLLDQARQTTDEVERLCYIAAFVVSGYACSKNRSGRKSL